MRVLLVTGPLQGHFFPLVPLTWALRAAGHDVVVATHATFAPVVASAGLPAVTVGRGVPPPGPQPVGRPVLGSWERPSAPSALHTSPWFVRLAADVLADLVDVCTAWRPDLVVYEPLAFAGPLAAAVCGTPSIRHLWGVDVTHTMIAHAAPEISRLGRRYGIDAASVGRSLVVDPCPRSVQLPGAPRGISCQYVPFNGAAPVPESLLRPAGRPRVCVTVGTVLGGAGGLAMVRRVVEATEPLDVEIVVAVSRADRKVARELAAVATVVESVPLTALLPGCDLVVHHGGAGTSLTSLAYGLPQLILPHFADNFAHADQLTARGAARRADAAAPPCALRTEIRMLLEQPDYRRSAEDVRREMRSQLAPSEVVFALQRHAENREIG